MDKYMHACTYARESRYEKLDVRRTERGTTNQRKPTSLTEPRKLKNIALVTTVSMIVLMLYNASSCHLWKRDCHSHPAVPPAAPQNNRFEPA